MAEEAGIDWKTLAGSARAARSFAAGCRSLPCLPGRSRGAEERWSESHVQLPLIQSVRAGSQLRASSIPLSGVRAIIAERMAQSHNQTAPVTLTAEADATRTGRDAPAAGRAMTLAVSYNDLLAFHPGQSVARASATRTPRWMASRSSSGRASTSAWPWTPIAGCWCRWCAMRIKRGWHSLRRKPRLWLNGRAAARYARRADAAAPSR